MVLINANMPFQNSVKASEVLKMSWDSYIDNLIAQTKDASGKAHCDKACIIGLDGGAPWTTSNHPNALQVIPQIECHSAYYGLLSL